MKPGLSAGAFYGLIAGGLALGAASAAGGAWAYLDGGRPRGRGVFDGAAAAFVLPVATMVGATFGGLAGVTAAVVLERWRRPE